MEVCRIMPEKGVVQCHQTCRTKGAEWLCLENMYFKLNRPNQYDIGGTMVEDIPNFWFCFQTERVDNLYLIHIFVYNRSDSEFNVSISANSEITVNEKLNSIFLTSNLKKLSFKKATQKTLYLTTYSFTELVVGLLKNRKLFIPVRINKEFLSGQIENILIFDTLLKDPVGTDFTMESADEVKFNVHKILLSTFSDVFEAMLKENNVEGQNNYVKLVDVNKDDLVCILEFIYSGTVKNIQDYNFFNILILAERYDIKGLKELSESVLKNQISDDNVIETLVVADLHNAHNLKRAAFQFLKDNPQAIHSDMFKDLGNMELVQEIFKYLIPAN